MGLPADGIALVGDQTDAVDAGKTLLGWQVKAGLVFIPTLIYGALFLFEKFPATERVQAGISSRSMYMEIFRPMFILWAICMLMTASVELGPQQWQNSVLDEDVRRQRNVHPDVYERDDVHAHGISRDRLHTGSRRWEC